MDAKTRLENARQRVRELELERDKIAAEAQQLEAERKEGVRQAAVGGDGALSDKQYAGLVKQIAGLNEQTKFLDDQIAVLKADLGGMEMDEGEQEFGEVVAQMVQKASANGQASPIRTPI